MSDIFPGLIGAGPLFDADAALGLDDDDLAFWTDALDALAELRKP